MTVSPYFDPDEIILTKPIIRKIINGIIERWKVTQGRGFFGIKGLEAFRLSLRFQTDDEIKEIFSSIIRCVNEMQMVNAMLKMKGENPKTEELADMILKKLDSGELLK